MSRLLIHEPLWLEVMNIETSLAMSSFTRHASKIVETLKRFAWGGGVSDEVANLFWLGMTLAGGGVGWVDVTRSGGACSGEAEDGSEIDRRSRDELSGTGASSRRKTASRAS